MNNFSKYWLLLPLILFVFSISFSIQLSKESARLNRHLDHLKYTDFISLWWAEGDFIRFYCVPDDAEKIMQGHGVKNKPKQAIYTTFTMKKKDLFAAQDPVQLVTDRLAIQIQDRTTLHLTKYSWDKLYAKAHFRHFSFRHSSFVCWVGFTLAAIYFILLLLWHRRRMIIGGFFVCLVGILINVWWYAKPLQSLNIPDSEIIWEWALSGRTEPSFDILLPVKTRDSHAEPLNLCGFYPPSPWGESWLKASEESSAVCGGVLYSINQVRHLTECAKFSIHSSNVWVEMDSAVQDLRNQNTVILCRYVESVQI